MHHFIVETLLIVGCTHGSSGVYAYICWVAAQVQGENIMHCWHYGGCTKGDHGSWSEYSYNMSLSLSWSLMVSGGLWFFFADLVHIQGEHVLRGSITLCPWCQRGRMKLKILRLPSSPKGEIVGIMVLVWLYVSDVVLDGNTHGMALILIKIKKYAGEQFRRCVPAGMPCRDRVLIRGLPIHEVRTPVHTFQGS